MTEETNAGVTVFLAEVASMCVASGLKRSRGFSISSLDLYVLHKGCISLGCHCWRQIANGIRKGVS